MAHKGIRHIKTLSEETSINPKTLTAYIDNKIKRYDADVLERLCKYFNCQPGDLLEYVPEED